MKRSALKHDGVRRYLLSAEEESASNRGPRFWRGPDPLRIEGVCQDRGRVLADFILRSALFLPFQMLRETLLDVHAQRNICAWKQASQPGNRFSPVRFRSASQAQSTGEQCEFGIPSSMMFRNAGHSPGRTPDCTRSARALRLCRKRDSNASRPNASERASL